MAQIAQLTRSQRWWGVANVVAAVVFTVVSLLALVMGLAGALSISWGFSLGALSTLGAVDYLVWHEDPPAWLRTLQVIAFLVFLGLTVARIL